MATIAVVGPGSLLGVEILSALQTRHDVTTLLPLSEKAAGIDLEFRGETLMIEALDDDAVDQKPDAVIFATGAARAGRWAAKFAAAGSRVVDASSAHRLSSNVPLVGSGPPPDKKAKLVAVPGAAPLAAARLLGPVFAKAAAPALTATLLFPVSSAGQAGVAELSHQTGALLGGRAVKARRFPHRIAFNLIPEVGEADAADTTLEASFVGELKRLLSLPALAVAATALRVPVFHGLTLVLAGSGVGPVEVRRRVVSAPGLKLLEGKGIYPMPSLSVGDPSILVGRIRDDGRGGFQLVAVVDAQRLVAEVAVAAVL